MVRRCIRDASGKTLPGSSVYNTPMTLPRRASSAPRWRGDESSFSGVCPNYPSSDSRGVTPLSLS